MEVINTYEVTPVTSQKSFYGNARVTVYEDGTEILTSYKTEVLRKNPDGTFDRLWDDWSATTAKHVYAWSGIRTAEWHKMEVKK